MTPRNVVILGDCIERLRELDADSVDAIVCDPPYGLEFMGKAWDGFDTAHAFGEWCRQWATEALRVLKPGGHLLAFGGTRTYHRLVCGIEDAGFEVRDTIAWLYGSGFPKSLDVSKAVDKAAGAKRETKLWKLRHRTSVFAGEIGDDTATSGNLQCPQCDKWKFAVDYCRCSRDSGPATDAARTWSGFGTALKPAHEPIVVARKPLAGTVAANVERYGTGALNIDGCRVGEAVETWPASRSYAPGQMQPGHIGNTQPTGEAPAGRWPANIAHDGSVEVLELFPQDREASAARFFYCAKASRADREAGLGAVEEREHQAKFGSVQDGRPHTREGYVYPRPKRSNDHPTVKPHDLMRWLVRLVGGQRGSLILDPFAGSGSTLRAAKAEGFDFLGIERDPHYYRLACLRAGLPDPGEVAA